MASLDRSAIIKSEGTYLIVSSRSLLKTTSRNKQDVALYIWTITCLRPATASNVRLIRSARAGVSTCDGVLALIDLCQGIH